ncbi:GGDEF domain-containing protein [Allorhizobium pseudoryzae]|uniref:GGDEF domain-containing protein n=1 Tax=Allorhizobium pseudoryzae TaxID=379684 RepID=UPI003D01F0C2
MKPALQGVQRRHRGINPSILALAALAVVCTLLLAVSAISNSFSRVQAARGTAQWIEKFAIVFDAATWISAERGPANSYMAASAQQAAAARQAWQSAKAQTDAALAAVETLGVPARAVEDVRHQLMAGRVLVELNAMKPLERRTPGEVQQAIETMFKAWDRYRSGVMTRWGAAAIEQERLLADVVMKGAAFSDLREYAGRIGSYLIGPMTARVAIPEKNLLAITSLRNQIEQTWQLLAPARLVERVGSEFHDKALDVQRIYLTSGLQLIDEEIENGRTKGQFKRDAATFTQEYVQLMQPLTDLRNGYLESLKRTHENQTRSSTIDLFVDGALAIVLLALVPLFLAIIRIRILRPLLRGVADVIALAEGRKPGTRPKDHPIAEIASLFAAIRILEGRLTERARLTREFEKLSQTDSLTGLLNRRGFETEAHALAEHGPAALIIGDIDHFKEVNDRHGHPVGDRVLAGVASILRQTTGASCRIGRIGGEEFAVLCPGVNVEEATRLAEDIRRSVANHSFPLTETTSLTVSLSLGVAPSTYAGSWTEQVRQADAALYCAKSDGRNCVRVVVAGNAPTSPRDISTAA